MDTVLAAGSRPWRLVHVSRETRLAIAIMLGLLAVAAVASLPLLDRGPFLPHPNLSWWALALGFATAETCVQHLQGRRHAQTFSLSEIPLVLGLFMATPAQLLLGQVVGLLFTLTFIRRSPGVKIAFNTILHASEAAVAMMLFRALAAAFGGTPRRSR